MSAAAGTARGGRGARGRRRSATNSAGARGLAPLRTIAIVDDTPDRQYLLPEFMLYRRLLEQAGLRVLIADAAALYGSRATR